MTGILTEPVSAPDVWRGDELAGAGRWVIRFTREDFAGFERALAHVSRNHLKDVTRIRAEDFPLPHFQERTDDIVNRLEHGLGLVLLRGLAQRPLSVPAGLGHPYDLALRAGVADRPR